MIEHRYPKGNRLTLTLLESLGSSPDPAQIGAELLSQASAAYWSCKLAQRGVRLAGGAS